MFIRVWVFSVMLMLVAVLSNEGQAGELECSFGCDVSGYSNIEWKPSSCYKPSTPYFSAYDRDSYNSAVNQYNSYIGEVESYINCMVSEANSDIQLLPNIISEQLNTHRRNIMNDLDEVKQSLSSARLMIE